MSADMLPALGGGQDLELLTAVAALPALPAPDHGSRYNVHRLTAGWLGEQSELTQRAYFRDLAGWLTWCDQTGLDPLTARTPDVGEYRIHLGGRGLAKSTVARALAAVSSWYQHLQSADAVQHNPVGAAKRPKVDRDATTTVGLSLPEAAALLRAADEYAVDLVGLRDRALVRLLLAMGLRVGELVSMPSEALTANEGYAVLRYVAKGGKDRERPVDPYALVALQDYRQERMDVVGRLDGALLATHPAPDRTGRMDPASVRKVVRRLARDAGVTSWERLSPHSGRHAFATMSLNSGVSLRDLQDSMGHADPRTTRRYDRARGALARDASLRVGPLLAAAAAGYHP